VEANEVGGREMGREAEEVNSKKPPYLCEKYLETPLFGEIIEIHQF
jgi:hypothetical protein